MLLSVASVWEMQIKLQLGKLHLRLPLAEVVAEQQQTNDIQVCRSPWGMSWPYRTCQRITRTRLIGC